MKIKIGPTKCAIYELAPGEVALLDAGYVVVIGTLRVNVVEVTVLRSGARMEYSRGHMVTHYPNATLSLGAPKQ